MAHLYPGDVFKLVWPPLGIDLMVIRISDINYGTLQSGEITLTCMEDIWATQEAIYSTPQETGWITPIAAPAISPEIVLVELPFYALVVEWGMATVLGFDTALGYLAVAAIQPSQDAFDYELYVRDAPAADLTTEGWFSFTPTATLDAELLKNAVDATIQLNDVYNLEAVDVGSYVLIEDEICKILDVDTALNQIEIARGILDTVPEAHAADTYIFFIGTLVSLVSRQYTVTDTPGIKVLPRTGKGQLAIGDASVQTATAFASRQIRPYPPGNFKINTVSYPASFSGQPTLTWTDRDRLLQTILIEHSEGDIGPEAGTTYTVKVYDEDNNLVRTEAAATSPYVYTEAFERADCGLGGGDPLNTQLRFVLYSVRDGYDSWQQYDLTVPRV